MSSINVENGLTNTHTFKFVFESEILSGQTALQLAELVDVKAISRVLRFWAMDQDQNIAQHLQHLKNQSL